MVRMGALVLRPVAGRAPLGAHGLREGFWRFGRSFWIDSCAGRRRWNDDVEGSRNGRPARLGFGQRHRDAARAAGRAAAALAGGRSAALVVRCRRSELGSYAGLPNRKLGCMIGCAKVRNGRGGARHLCARGMHARDMQVADMGAGGGRHELDSDQHDRSPDQCCQPSPPAHDTDWTFKLWPNIERPDEGDQSIESPGPASHSPSALSAPPARRRSSALRSSDAARPCCPTRSHARRNAPRDRAGFPLPAAAMRRGPLRSA
jgi:hypothetical protein